jgi:glycosyltransferase involved in cell wall biosynthesis
MLCDYFYETLFLSYLQLFVLYIETQYNLSDDLLSYYYSNANFFIFPSLYEGFGIPILEAFSCSCPLLCSNSSSFTEIASDAARYFDPYSEESISDAIMSILNNEALRSNLIDQGKERLHSFSWDESALKTRNIYEEIL